MRQIGDLWVWVDPIAHRLMLGNKAAAEAYQAGVQDQDMYEPAIDTRLPDISVCIGVFSLEDGPAMAFHVAIDPAVEPWPGMLAGVLSGLLAPMAVDRPSDVRVDYVNTPDGRSLWLEGRQIASGPVQGTPGAEGFNLTFELVRLLLADRPLMCLLHGSAVRWRGANIVFMGQSGSGKSTLAALLAAQGGQYLGDDHVALMQAGFSVQPLPMAPSIKEGAWPVVAPHFPQLMGAQVFHKGPDPFRLMPDAPMLRSTDAGPVDVLVFPQFDAEKPPKTVELTPIETLLKLSRAGLWLDPGQGEGLIDWAMDTPAIALRHGPEFAATEAALLAALKAGV